MKRLFDFFISLAGLAAASPILLPVMLLVWLQDYKSPFYIASRVGRGESTFRMVKMRSMVVNADASGVDSTAGDDPRITGVGRFVRKYKIDELTQLWNVLLGDMSMVGPRPNVKRETDLYTNEEKALLSVKPGITDLASIIFSDEGDILENSADPDIDYNQLIRPWKSRLGLFYIQNRTIFLDFQLILLTAVAILSRDRAIKGVTGILIRLGADEEMVRVAKREEPLKPTPPPGSEGIVTSR